MTDTTTPAPLEGRRTIRRFAHELYPHPDEAEVRPLAVDVPYLYALALGHEVWESDWFDLGRGEDGNLIPGSLELRLSVERTIALGNARMQAFLADALAQGMTGDAAWEWASVRNHPEIGGEFIYERAVHYGVDPDLIKPYPVLAECAHHTHSIPHESGRFNTQKRIHVPESACMDCTEPLPVTEDDDTTEETR